MMCEFVDFLKALAPFAWPAFAFTALFTLKRELKDFISRIRKGRVLGAEIDLDQTLDEWKASVDLAKSEAPAPEHPVSSDTIQPRFADQILNEAGSSSLAAFMRLSSELERVANNIVADFQPAERRHKMSLQQAIRRMPVEFVSGEIRKSIGMFSSVRNKIVHEYHTVNNAEILRAIDIGLNLLSVLEVVDADLMNLKNEDGAPKNRRHES
jgi:hypothetical protein